MESVFISYKFRDSDRQVAANVKRLVQSHLLTPQDGEDLGGEQLWAEVDRRIQSAEALVALFLLPHDPTDHTWLRTEYDRACDNKKPVIALVENGFGWTDPRNKEYAKLDRGAPLDGFLKLSATLGVWRRDAGQRVQVKLLPEMMARLAARQGYSCRYRLNVDNDPISDWITVNPGGSVAGFGFRASGIRENVNIEIEVNDGTRTIYFSAADPYCIPAELRAFEQK
jgi:hypothetical protein